MMKIIFFLLTLTAFLAAITFVNLDNAYAQTTIKFDQNQIVMGHSDYVTLSELSPFAQFSLTATPVLDENFETTFDWIQLQSGVVTQNNVGVANAVSGNFVASKITNDDPHGAIKQLGSTVDDFELTVYAKKINTSGGDAIRYSITQDITGNGYGFYLTDLKLVIEKRYSAFVAFALDSQTQTWDLGEWNTFRFFKVGNNLTLELYKNDIIVSGTFDAATPTTTLSVTDSSFAGGFNYAAINGGHDFDTDDFMVWGTLAAQQPQLPLTTIQVSVDNCTTSETTGPITLSADDDGILRTLVEFTDTGVSGNNPPILNISGCDTVKAEFVSFDVTVEDTAEIIKSAVPVVQDDADRYVASALLDCSISPYGGDGDGDGICDSWELNDRIEVKWDNNPQDGQFLGDELTKVYTYNCDAEDGGDIDSCTPEYRDIFIEIDYMQSHRPNIESLENIKNAFLNASPFNASRGFTHNNPGIFFHYQLDDDDTQSIFHNDKTYFPGSDDQILVGTEIISDRGYDQLKSEFFGITSEKTVLDDWANFSRLLKMQIFHYVLFIHSQAGDVLSSGEAEWLGTDLIVSLGSFDGMIGTIDQQEGTLMHEIGHNLDLGHGGGDSINCKPNYLSVMSYSRQFEDPVSDRELDFSKAKLGSVVIDEDALHETNLDPEGIENFNDQTIVFYDGNIVNTSYKTGKPVSWGIQNVNSIPEICSSLDSDEVLEGYDDWANIDLNFKNSPGNYADGRSDGSDGSLPNVPNKITKLMNLLNINNPNDYFNNFCLLPETLAHEFDTSIDSFDRIDGEVLEKVRKHRTCMGGVKSTEDSNSIKQKNLPVYGSDIISIGYWPSLVKSEGVKTHQFGSATKDVVCGDHLCVNIDTKEKGSLETDKNIEEYRYLLGNPPGLSSEHLKSFRMFKIDELKQFVNQLDWTDFAKNSKEVGESNRKKIINQYVIAREYIKQDRMVEAIQTLQDIDYNKYIINQEKKDLLKNSAISVKKSIGKSIPEFGEITVLIMIPMFIVIIFVSRTKNLGKGWSV